MSTNDINPGLNFDGQAPDPSERQMEEFIRSVLSAEDPQFNLPQHFAEAVAAKAMPQVVAHQSLSESKGFAFTLATLAILVFLAACWYLNVGEYFNALSPYKYLLAVAMLLLVVVQWLDVKLVKQKRSLL